MKALKMVWDFLNSRVGGYVILFLLVVFLIGTCKRSSSLRDDIQRHQNNVEALTDKLREERTHSGELRASIQGYVANTRELEIYNRELAEQVKNERGKVITLNNIVFNLRQDVDDLNKYIDELLTKFNEPVQVDDSTWRVDWNLAYTYDEYNYDRYTGRTIIGLTGDVNLLRDITLNHRGTSLLNRDSQMRLTWGQTEEDGKLRVYAQTAHPAFRAQLLEGVYVDYPAKRNWFTGISVGPHVGMSWNFNESRVITYVGVGLQYNIYHW